MATVVGNGDGQVRHTLSQSWIAACCSWQTQRLTVLSNCASFLSGSKEICHTQVELVQVLSFKSLYKRTSADVVSGNVAASTEHSTTHGKVVRMLQ